MDCDAEPEALTLLRLVSFGELAKDEDCETDVWALDMLRSDNESTPERPCLMFFPRINMTSSSLSDGSGIQRNCSHSSL